MWISLLAQRLAFDQQHHISNHIAEIAWLDASTFSAIGSKIMETIVNKCGYHYWPKLNRIWGKMKFHYQNIYQSSIQLSMSASNHHDRYLPWASENKYAT
eukprot:TRINITY_DN107322_c0_g1_i1.p1 TRINITY_DN107322_c0_g1~~TRINITY_DN107322_c0_g1_i1.p1  ORF type:complete len:100 (+),score=2.05 TRINITY_DN107322_c0_g1_i1:140-439(+)